MTKLTRIIIYFKDYISYKILNRITENIKRRLKITSLIFFLGEALLIALNLIISLFCIMLSIILIFVDNFYNGVISSMLKFNIGIFLICFVFASNLFCCLFYIVISAPLLILNFHLFIVTLKFNNFEKNLIKGKIELNNNFNEEDYE